VGKNEPPDARDKKVNKRLSSTTVLILLIGNLALSGCASLYASYFMKDPLTAEEHNNLGVIYEREGKSDLALREYKRAASLDGSLVTPLVNIGNVYLKEDNYEEAEKYYRKALGKNKYNLEAANNLASLYLDAGENYEEGIKYLLTAAEPLDPVPAYALDTLGMLYLRSGDKEKAEIFLLQACKTASANEELQNEIRSHVSELGKDIDCR